MVSSSNLAIVLFFMLTQSQRKVNEKHDGTALNFQSDNSMTRLCPDIWLTACLFCRLTTKTPRRIRFDRRSAIDYS